MGGALTIPPNTGDPPKLVALVFWVLIEPILVHLILCVSLPPAAPKPPLPIYPAKKNNKNPKLLHPNPIFPTNFPTGLHHRCQLPGRVTPALF